MKSLGFKDNVIKVLFDSKRREASISDATFKARILVGCCKTSFEVTWLYAKLYSF